MSRAELPKDVAARVARLAPISLDELQAQAALHARTDHKYVVSIETLVALLDELAADHRVLEIDGRRSFAYRSVYFDSVTLGAFRAHVQGRRRRYKLRTRHYVDSDMVVFEVKLKGVRGETVKHQLPSAPGRYGVLDPDARRFAEDVLGTAYGVAPGAMEPSVETRYRRVTLAAADGASRITCDFGLRFGAGEHAPGLRDGYVIVETKSASGRGPADRALQRLGARPAPISKYCAGVALLREDVKDNVLRRMLRRYFTPGRSTAPIPEAARG